MITAVRENTRGSTTQTGGPVVVSEVKKIRSDPARSMVTGTNSTKAMSRASATGK